MNSKELEIVLTMLKGLSRNKKEKYADGKIDTFDCGYDWAINDVWAELNKLFNNGDNSTTIHNKEN